MVIGVMYAFHSQRNGCILCMMQDADNYCYLPQSSNWKTDKINFNPVQQCSKSGS